MKTLNSGQWKTSGDKADHHRRSIYIFARRNLRYPLFATFDRPAANCSCATRIPSPTAIQSLLLLNSALTMDASKHLASNCITQHAGNPRAQIHEIFQRVLSRPPSREDEIDCIAFLARQTAMVRQQGYTQPIYVGQCSTATNFCTSTETPLIA